MDNLPKATGLETSLWLLQPVLKRWVIQIALMGTRNWETERLSKLAMELKGEGCSDVKLILKITLGFPGGAVVENLPADAGDTGSSPGLGRSHMPRSN